MPDSEDNDEPNDSLATFDFYDLVGPSQQSLPSILFLLTTSSQLSLGNMSGTEEFTDFWTQKARTFSLKKPNFRIFKPINFFLVFQFNLT
jgi:hypothetical protein